MAVPGGRLLLLEGLGPEGHLRQLAPQAPLILCAMHGALFEIETGVCVSGPCAGLGLRTLPVRVERGYVLLDDGVALEEPPDLGR
jgi:nitrite reductase/ring-hydroxylating ferredoxin subunit